MLSVLQAFPSLIIILPKMKSSQYLTTAIALTLLTSHQAFAAPASGNQARSDRQSNIYPMAFPVPSDNVAISNIGTVGNQIGVVSGNLPSNTVVISNGNNGMTTVESTSPTGGTVVESSSGTVVSGNIPPSVVNIAGA